MQFRITPVVKNLIIINVLMYVAMIVAKSSGIYLDDLFSVYFPMSSEFKPFQIVTHMFMHAPPWQSIGVTHLLMNMLMLFFVGVLVESQWSAQRFLTYYLVCGFGAMLLHWTVIYFEIRSLEAGLDANTIHLVRTEGAALLKNSRNYVDPALAQLNYKYNIGTLGASGAVFGVLLALGMLFPNVPMMIMFIPIPIKAKYLVAGYAALELFFGTIRIPGDNIAHFAHLGGMLFGYLLIKFWQITDNR